MILGPDGKLAVMPVITKAKMHKCLFCGRRSRLGTHCCNAHYREDSKFNSESKGQKLDRLDYEKQRKNA